MSILLLTFRQQQLQCCFHRSLGILSAEAGCARPPDILSLQNQESPSAGRLSGVGAGTDQSVSSVSTFQIPAHCPPFRAFSPTQSVSSDSVRGPGWKGICKKASKYISGLVATYCHQISFVQLNIFLHFPKTNVLKLNLCMGCFYYFFSG